MKERKKVWTVSDLPAEERPRERLLKLGPQSVSTQELLAIIIASGVKDMPVMMAAQCLLSCFGSLSKIADASEQELKMAIKGLGPAKIARLKACFELARRLENEEHKNELHYKDEKITNPALAYSLIKKHIRAYKKEHFFVVSLDSRNRILGVDEISTGTLEASIVHPRETFESAIKRQAAKIIIAHNHPSDDPAPSEDDIGITARLKEAGLIMGIELIDHIVICKNSFFSFKEKGLIF
ncbi:MAG: RadC family protein [Candidatus Ratteibacteria bacterium]